MKRIVLIGFDFRRLQNPTVFCDHSLYPLFVALIWRFFKSLKAITLGLLVLFIASLVLNLFVTFWKPTEAFYFLPTRGWELAAGGLAYLLARQNALAQVVKQKGYWLGSMTTNDRWIL